MKRVIWLLPLLIAMGCDDTTGGGSNDLSAGAVDMTATPADMRPGRDAGVGPVDGGPTDGGDEDAGEAEGPDMRPMPVYKVQSADYTVSDLVAISDGCGENLSTTGATPFATLAVYNSGAGVLRLGNLRTPFGSYPQYDPEGYTQGAGNFVDLYNGTTTLSTTVKTDAAGTCQFALSRTNVVKVTGDNRLSVDFTEVQTSHGAGCVPVNVDCTSHYSYRLAYH
jgi:hypothetical protein